MKVLLTSITFRMPKIIEVNSLEELINIAKIERCDIIIKTEKPEVADLEVTVIDGIVL